MVIHIVTNLNLPNIFPKTTQFCKCLGKNPTKKLAMLEHN